MKILVTGGAGFIGSNLVSKLIEKKNNKIVVLDNLSTGSEKNIQEFLKFENFEFYKYDITDSSIIDFIKNLNVDEIYNLACPASPKYYLKYPIETWEASVIGMRNLLQAINGTRIKMIHSSTSEVYGDALEYPQTENYWGNVNPIGVRACYDEGKRAAEALIYDYIRQYDVDVRVVRIFNTYGPKMNPLDGRIISNFIMQALSNDDITIYGNGKQTRSFCFIDDTVNCLIKLMNLDHKNETPINVGNPYELSVGYVAEFIKERIGSSSQMVYLNEMSDDPKKRKPNISKAKKIIDWESCVNFEDGIDATIDYFKNIE